MSSQFAFRVWLLLSFPWIFLFSHVSYLSCLSHPALSYYFNNIWRRRNIVAHSLCSFFHPGTYKYWCSYKLKIWVNNFILVEFWRLLTVNGVEGSSHFCVAVEQSWICGVAAEGGEEAKANSCQCIYQRGESVILLTVENQHITSGGSSWPAELIFCCRMPPRWNQHRRLEPKWTGPGWRSRR
jgi:hypothetical protein